MIKNFSLVALFLTIAWPVAAADLPPASQVGITAYTKGHLIDDFMHCAAYNRIAADCSTANPPLAQQYGQAAAIAAESAIKLAIAAGVTPEQFKPKLAQIDAEMRARVNGSCSSTLLSGQYAIMCRDLAADVAPRTIYWADRYQAERKAAGDERGQ